MNTCIEAQIILQETEWCSLTDFQEDGGKYKQCNEDCYNGRALHQMATPSPPPQKKGYNMLKMYFKNFHFLGWEGGGKVKAC